jgi:hypothetical protein
MFFSKMLSRSLLCEMEILGIFSPVYRIGTEVYKPIPKEKPGDHNSDQPGLEVVGQSKLLDDRILSSLRYLQASELLKSLENNFLWCRRD